MQLIISARVSVNKISAAPHPSLAEIGHTFLLFFLIFDQFPTPHLDFFKVVDLEISCLGSRSLIPELEYVSSYVTFHFNLEKYVLSGGT